MKKYTSTSSTVYNEDIFITILELSSFRRNSFTTNDELHISPEHIIRLANSMRFENGDTVAEKIRSNLQASINSRVAPLDLVKASMESNGSNVVENIRNLLPPGLLPSKEDCKEVKKWAKSTAAQPLLLHSTTTGAFVDLLRCIIVMRFYVS